MDPPTESAAPPLPQETSPPPPTPPPNAARVTEASSKDKKILFGTADAAIKFVQEKFEIEDDVYITAADKIKEIEQVTVVETETTDNLRKHTSILKVSRSCQFRNEPHPQPIVFNARPVAVSMHIAAEKYISLLTLNRERPKGTPRPKDIKIKVDGGANKVSDWSWNGDTVEESWEDMGIEQHHAKVTWAEQCYMEKCRQEEPKTLHCCYQQSLLRWSLTIGEK
ncbi:hypothetical protein IFR05_003360 [Cadophora sp. M221]|nr:hypothetical protein IFR05_003360 [Cadophora sp. M221]